MATRSGNVSPSNSSDAYFRAWGKWISDCFSAFGWVQTADTGQANWTTILAPTTTWTSQGYEIWRMADALQATAPVFLKIEYGSAGTATYPWIRLTVGTGSDGAGNLTGVVFTGTQIYPASQSATAYPSYASGASNRIAVQMTRSSSMHFLFTVERTHDAAGADTNVGVMVFWQLTSSGWGSRESHFSGSNPASYAAWNQSQFPPSGSGAMSPDIHVYPIRCWTPGESFPSMNLVAYVATDFTDLSTYSITGYDGVSRTYLAIGGSAPGNLNGDTVRQAGRYMIRWE